MSIPARLIPTLLTLTLGFLIPVEQADAQAMVSYGHGVAKAAGAGAAVGGGIGGVLTGLGNPLSKAAGGSGGASKGSAAVRRQTVPTRRGPVTWDVPQQSFGSPAPLPLVGGIRANGAGSANWQPSLLAPSQNLAVISASWGGPSVAGDDDSSEAAPVESATAEAPLTDGEAPVATEASQKMPVVLRATGQANSSGSNSSAQSGAAAPGALPEGIGVGISVDDLLKKLGRPYLSFRGVAGEGYTDQYVFELKDGAHLVVYVLDGVVSHLAVG